MERASALSAHGKTPIFLAYDGRSIGLIAVADTLRPEAFEGLAKLRSMNLDVVMLTGDNVQTAQAIARELGVEHVEAEVLPHDKAAVIKRLQADGRIVAMVGDGINDAPALVQADVGLAMGIGGVPGSLGFFFGTQGFLNPALAALAMAFSSVTVVTNSLRLRRTKV